MHPDDFISLVEEACDSILGEDYVPFPLEYSMEDTGHQAVTRGYTFRLLDTGYCKVTNNETGFETTARSVRLSLLNNTCY